MNSRGPALANRSAARLLTAALLLCCALFARGQSEPPPAAAAEPMPTQLPANLQWQTNDSDPVFADPNAKRGGRFRTFMSSFPPTLRLVGPDANSGFVGYLRDNNLSLVGRHPNTLNPIPELATHWAFGPDGRTVYFKLDPQARWSDGVPVTADDYVFVLEFMRSKFIVAPWYNNYYSEIITDIVKYDDHTIGVRESSVKPPNELIVDVNLGPVPKHFHKLDEHWVDDYNWRVEPCTGPYAISDIRKGKYVEFKRIDDWWANDKRYFQHRFNAEYVRIKVIRDVNIAYNYFSKGELDAFPLTVPRFWYKKAQGAPFDDGYIDRIKFYTDTPQPMQGMYLNEDDPVLADRNVRYGLAHAMNFDKMIATVLRGDYERKQSLNEGYGDYSNRSIRARSFDLEAADRYFKLAGWSERGPDGVRVKNGQRLSLRVSYASDEHTPRLVVLKQEAAKAGVELTLRLLDPTTSYKETMEKKHQIAWMAWSGGGEDVAPRYWEFFHSDNAHKPQTNNVTNTSDPAMDKKIIAYRDATTKDERVRLARELEQMVFDDGAFIPGYKVPYTREGFWRWMKLPASHGTRTTEQLFEPFGSTGGLFWIDEGEKDEVQQARILGTKFDPVNLVDETWRVKTP
jgi:microcin C transport system substrate-binding protein